MIDYTTKINKKIKQIRTKIYCFVLLFNVFALLSYSFSSLGIDTNQLKNSDYNDDIFVPIDYNFYDTNVYNFLTNEIDGNTDLYFDGIISYNDSLKTGYEYDTFIRNAVGTLGNSIDFNDASVNSYPNYYSVIDSNYHLQCVDDNVVSYWYTRHQMTLSDYLFVNFTVKCVSDDYIEVQIRFGSPLRSGTNLIIYDDSIYYDDGLGATLLYTDDFTNFLWISFEIFNNDTWRVNYQNDNSYTYLDTQSSVSSQIYEVYITTASDNSITGVWYFSEFQLINNIDIIDGLVIFDFYDLIQSFSAFYEQSWSKRTFMLFNISGSFEMGSFIDLDDYINYDITYTDNDWSISLDDKNGFVYTREILSNYVDDNCIYFRFDDYLNITHWEIFTSCYMEGQKSIREYVGYEGFYVKIERLTGYDTSLIENDGSYISLNYFYIDDTDNKLYTHVDYSDDTEINYLDINFLLPDDNFYSNQTAFRVISDFNDNIANAYLNLSFYSDLASYDYSYIYNLLSTPNFQFFPFNKTYDDIVFRNINFRLSQLSKTSYSGLDLTSVISNVSVIDVAGTFFFTFETIQLFYVFPSLVILIAIPYIASKELTKGKLFLIWLLFTNIFLIASGILPLWVGFILLVSNSLLLYLKYVGSFRDDINDK